TASHFFAFNAAMSPGNAVFSGFDVSPNVFASADAMSTSKPMIVPLVDVSSIGGNVGSVQNVNVPARGAAPAALASANASAAAVTAPKIDLRIRLLLPRNPKPGAYSDTARSASSSSATFAAARAVGCPAPSYGGETSTTSAPTSRRPRSARSSATASAVEKPAISGVPVPGAKSGSRKSMSNEKN